MKISIAERLHPFSHTAGTLFLIPHTSWSVQVFPTRLCFSDLEGQEASFFLSFDFEGPIREFTAELNLEQNLLCVFGKTEKGYMRYKLQCKEEGIWLEMEKVPLEKVSVYRSLPLAEFSLSKGEAKCICAFKGECLPTLERLSLGMHKAQDWDLVRRRLDCKEIFPHWLRLSQLSPAQISPTEPIGNFSLLDVCRKKIEQRDKEGILEAFEHLFLAAFSGVLVPRSTDTDHQGIASNAEEYSQGTCPLPLLTESGKLIRSLFFRENEGILSLLPCLPTPFHSGRMVGIRIASNTLLSLEWSKKALRRVIIEPGSTEEIQLQLPKGTRSFRVISARGSKKVVDVDSKGRATLPIEMGKTLQLDRLLD